MFSVELSEISKQSFKAFNFKDGSIYYGETAYLNDENELITDLEKIDDSKIKTLKLIRHGYGAQLFGVEDIQCLCKYEGQWLKDQRTGKGTCFFSDKSTYEGSMENGIFNGIGKFSWSNGNVYIGEWRNGKLNGEGEFKHYDGHILKGTFRNNYYLEDSNDSQGFIFINPFQELAILDLNREYTKMFNFSKLNKLTGIDKELIFNITLNNNNTTELVKTINYIINEKDKTPFILKDKNLKLSEIESFLEKSLNNKIKTIDFRSLHSNIESTEYRKEYISELEATISECVFNGYVLLLNFDDNNNYDKLFDPPLSNYYKKLQLSENMFIPSLFKDPEKFKHFSKQSHIRRFDKLIHNDFKFIVYSKFNIGKTDDSVSKEMIVMLFEKRFGKQLNIENLNLVVLKKDSK